MNFLPVREINFGTLISTAAPL